jgi:2-keto-3-deoxy-L-fuconate dehydrogenase
MFSLDGKTALITGAASGIGLAIAQCFAHAGAVVYLADVDTEQGKAETDALIEREHDAAFVELDVRDEEACDAVAQGILDARGGVDALVNNAGVGAVGTAIETSGEDLDRLYAVNVRGVFNVTKAFLPGMLERGSGSVVNIASIGGVLGIKDRVAYCATKFAVVGLTKSMALDHAGAGVRFNAICPARVETPFVTNRIKEYDDPEAAYREMTATQPVGRMGKPEEIAAAALYLAADESRFVTGSALIIDGGWSAG